MDKNDVKTCIRALLTSTKSSYFLNSLLQDFQTISGCDLPLFGCKNAVEFLQSIPDTVRLLGSQQNPEICLVESQKSAHITLLVEKQRKKGSTRRRNGPKKIVLPNDNRKKEGVDSQKERIPCLLSLKLKTLEPLSQNSSHLPPTESNRFHTQAHYGMNESLVPREVEKNLRNSTTSSLKNTDLSYKVCTLPSNGRTQVEETKHLDVENSDSCFEDFSGIETSNDTDTSFEDCARSSSSLASSRATSHHYINEGIKNKLKQIIKEFPNGLWCCELPSLFFEKFNQVLDYREFGFTSLIEMLSELPDVFRCVRPDHEDWMLFDATLVPSAEEKKMKHLQLIEDGAREIKANLEKLVINWCDSPSDVGVELEEIPILYKKTFGCALDFQSLGFKNLKSLLETFDGISLKISKANGKLIVKPMTKLSVSSSINWKKALPPITAENDIFFDIFPKDVVGPKEHLVKLDLHRHVAIGRRVDVCAAEVWSPSEFYLQLNKFKEAFDNFMDDLQKFYNIHLNKYQMPDATIRPEQVCCALYNSDPKYPDEWHRAQVIKVINEKTVSVNLVDFGTVARIKKNRLRFLQRSFQSFPIQAFRAKLAGVAPLNGEKKWPLSTSKKFLELLRVPYLDAEIIDVDFKESSTSVILFDPSGKKSINLNRKLVFENLAMLKRNFPIDGLKIPFDKTVKEKSKSRPEEEEEEDFTSTMIASLKPFDTPQQGTEINDKSPDFFEEFVDIVDLDKKNITLLKTVPNYKTVKRKL